MLLPAFIRYVLLFLLLFSTALSFSQERPFITIWETEEEGESIIIPTEGEGYDYELYWESVEDEEINNTLTGLDGDVTITFDEPGTYRVAISGDFPRIYFHEVEDDIKRRLKNIEQWGDIEWESMQFAFDGCTNMIMTAIDIPDLSGVDNMSFMFNEAKSFNGDISSWDVSNITNMVYLFFEAYSFNQDIGDWDVSNVENMTGMFISAHSFNQDISDWDVSSVISMMSMFLGAQSFNQNIGSWDVSNVENMRGVFIESGLSTTNYDHILQGWAELESLQEGVLFGANPITYCNAEEARQQLIDDYGWDISDGGKAENCLVTSTESPQETTLQLYPNPAANHIFIESGNGTLTQADIMDRTGKTVRTLPIANQQDVMVDVGDLSAGVYLVRVHTDQSVRTVRFVKE